MHVGRKKRPGGGRPPNSIYLLEIPRESRFGAMRIALYLPVGPEISFPLLGKKHAVLSGLLGLEEGGLGAAHKFRPDVDRGFKPTFHLRLWSVDGPD